MKTEDRDHELAEILDRAAMRLVPEPHLDRVMRRGGRRRAARLVAMVAAVAVFVAAVGWAGIEIRGNGGRGWVAAGSLRTTGWSLRHPASWRKQALPSCTNAPARTGIVVSDTDFVFRNPDGALPGCEDRLVLAGFPSDGVALALMPVGVRAGLLLPEPNTPFPLTFDRLEPTGGIIGGPGESYLGLIVRGDLMLILRTWVGSEAPAAAVRDLHETIASLTVQGATGWTNFRDRESGVSFPYPADWYSLPASADGQTTGIAAVSSFAPTPGRQCDAFPAPLGGLPQYGVALWVGELPPYVEGTWLPRPASFDPQIGQVERVDRCVPGGFKRWSTSFRAPSGRVIVVHVAFGQIAWNDDQVQRLVWHMLDGLSVGRTPSPETPTISPRPGPVVGAFQACPSLAGSVAPGLDARREVTRAALAYVRASNAGHHVAVDLLSDPAASRNGLDGLMGAASGPILAVRSAAGDPMVTAACGKAIALRTWRVTVDDGTTSASLDTWLYLIDRDTGWKVWGAY